MSVHRIGYITNKIVFLFYVSLYFFSFYQEKKKWSIIIQVYMLKIKHSTNQGDYTIKTKPRNHVSHVHQ